jgi:hypothetical protein
MRKPGHEPCQMNNRERQEIRKARLTAEEPVSTVLLGAVKVSATTKATDSICHAFPRFVRLSFSRCARPIAGKTTNRLI